jgi:hypothetical protein
MEQHLASGSVARVADRAVPAGRPDHPASVRLGTTLRRDFRPEPDLGSLVASCGHVL